MSYVLLAVVFTCLLVVLTALFHKRGWASLPASSEHPFIFYIPLSLVFMVLSIFLFGRTDWRTRTVEDTVIVASALLVIYWCGLAMAWHWIIGKLFKTKDRLLFDRKCKHDDIVRQLNGLIGQLTYDDALRLAGPPVEAADGNQVRVATWSRGFLAYPRRIQLTFDRRTGTLLEWKF